MTDRALARSPAAVLAARYAQDFLPGSFGGRSGLGAALATRNAVIAASKVRWALEADLPNFFRSLDHGWRLCLVEHRVGDPRLSNLIRRWLKAGSLEAGQIQPNEEGTPQGGSISVWLRNRYRLLKCLTAGSSGWLSPGYGARPTW